MATSCLHDIILNNCDFILAQDFKWFGIISESDDSGTRAHVLARDAGNQQSARFSSKTSASLDAALEDLHGKVAEAVAQRISELGFAAKPRLLEWRIPTKGIPRPPRRRHHSRRGSISSAGSSSSQDWQGLCLVEDGTSASSSSEDGEDDDGYTYPSPPTTRPRAFPEFVEIKGKPVVSWVGPAPPAPPSVPAIPAPPPHMRHRPSTVPRPPNSQQRRACNFIICITLAGTSCGSINVLDACVPTIPILKARIVTLARDNIHKFTPVPPHILSTFKAGLLAVSLNRMVVGDTTIEIGSFKDDMSFLCHGSNGCPRIEAVVHRYGPKPATVSQVPAARPALSPPSTHATIRPPAPTTDIQIVLPGASDPKV